MDHFDQFLRGRILGGRFSIPGPDMTLEQVNGPLHHLVHMGAMVGGQSDQFVQGDTRCADGQARTDHGDRPIVESGFRSIRQGSKQPIVHEQGNQALGDVGPVGHLSSRQTAVQRVDGQAAEVRGGIGGHGFVTEGSNLGQSESVVGEPTDLGQSSHVVFVVGGSTTLPDRGRDQPQALVVAHGVDAQASGRGYLVDGQPGVVAPGQGISEGHVWILRVSTLSVDTRTFVGSPGLNRRLSAGFSPGPDSVCRGCHDGGMGAPLVGSTPVDYIALTRDRYDALGYPPYQWVALPEPPPWTPLSRPLTESTVALIGSGGAYREGQTAFHWKDDTGVRRIPSADPATDIRVTHFAYDLEPAREDPNIVFPVDRLRELVDEGVLGGLASTALGCMGGIYSVRRATEELAPAIVAEVTAMDVDLALLVPV